jgi:protoheme IX farnesyltransferase
LPLTFLPALLGVSGLLYVVGVALLSAMFLYYAVNVYHIRDGAAANRACKKLFGFSILWLFLVFALIPVERLLGVASFPSVLP